MLASTVREEGRISEHRESTDSSGEQSFSQSFVREVEIGLKVLGTVQTPQQDLLPTTDSHWRWSDMQTFVGSKLV